MSVKDQIITQKYALYNSDCISTMKGIGANTIDMSIYSPP